MGIATGYLISVVGWAVVCYIEPSYTPPNFSAPIILAVSLVPEHLAQGAVFLLLLSLLSAIFPARHAAKQSVINALGHV
jgi:putative ABC transport system permease protein